MSEKNNVVKDTIILDKEALLKVEKYGSVFSSWFKNNLNRSVVPSAVAGVVYKDALIFSSGAHADIDTKFGIASLSKTFTAILTLQLVEEGKLSLDDPVRKYLPHVIIERNELGSEPVTIRHLIAHTSGIPSCAGKYVNCKINGDIYQIPEQVYPAGYCYAYTNVGYVLMKDVIEAATGISYSANLKKKIFDPLQMSSSIGDYSNGTGGIITTLRDLAKYASMLINRGRIGSKRLLSESLFNEMLAKPVELPHVNVDYYYSLSWEVMAVNQHVDSFYKAGRWFGESSGLQVFPSKDCAFIYLCNPPNHLTSSFMSWRQELTGKLRYLLRQIVNDPKLCSSWPQLSSKELKLYEGNYVNHLSGEKVKIIFKGDRLFSNRLGSLQPLTTFTSNRFLLSNGRSLHNFVWKNNRVIGLAVKNSYFQYE